MMKHPLSKSGKKKESEKWFDVASQQPRPRQQQQKNEKSKCFRLSIVCSLNFCMLKFKNKRISFDLSKIDY